MRDNTFTFYRLLEELIIEHGKAQIKYDLNDKMGQHLLAHHCALLIKWKYQYYVLSNSEVSDNYFDEIENYLKFQDPDNPILTQVGFSDTLLDRTRVHLFDKGIKCQ